MPQSTDNKFGDEIALLHKLLQAGERIGVPRELWDNLANNTDLLQQVMRFTSPQLSPATYKIETDYEQSAHEALSNGKLVVDPGILDHQFEVSGSNRHQFGVRLASFYRRRFRETTTMLTRLGYRHLNILELIAFASIYNTHLFAQTIVAGGSVNRGPDANLLVSIKKADEGAQARWMVGVEKFKVGHVVPDDLMFAVVETAGMPWHIENHRTINLRE